MKKQIFAIIFAIGILGAVSAGKTYAQSQAFKIEVPFEFTANNKTLPAGTYVVGPASDSRIVWKLQDAHQKPEAFLLAAGFGSNDTGNVGLTFRRYGDRNFLIGFKSFSYQMKLQTSASEKDYKRTWSGIAKNDLGIVVAVSGR